MSRLYQVALGGLLMAAVGGVAWLLGGGLTGSQSASSVTANRPASMVEVAAVAKTRKAGHPLRSAHTGGEVELVDLNTRQTIHTLNVGSAPDVAFSPDGAFMYVASSLAGDVLEQYSTQDMTRGWSISLKGEEVEHGRRMQYTLDVGPSTISVTPDGASVLTVMYSGMKKWIDIRDAGTGQWVSNSDMVWYCATGVPEYSSDGSILYWLCDGARVVKMSAVDFSILSEHSIADVIGTAYFSGAEHPYVHYDNAVAENVAAHHIFSYEDGDAVAVGTTQGRVVVIDLATMNLITDVEVANGSAVEIVGMAALDDTKLAIGTRELTSGRGGLHVLDVKGQEVVEQLPLVPNPFILEVSPGGRVVVAGGTPRSGAKQAEYREELTMCCAVGELRAATQFMPLQLNERQETALEEQFSTVDGELHPGTNGVINRVVFGSVPMAVH